VLNAEQFLPYGPNRLDFVRNKIAAILLDDVKDQLEVFLGVYKSSHSWIGLGDDAGNLAGVESGSLAEVGAHLISQLGYLRPAGIDKQ